jgi:DHA2 family methylenomycin A resistance protein-like MFS transporter
MTLGFAVVQLDVTVVNVGIKAIGGSFGGSIASLQWVVSSYTLALAALILTAGALGDRIGAKRMFLVGFAIFTAASVACGLASSLAVLIAARTIQGVGAAILVPCSLALLNHAYHDAGERTRAVGLLAAGASTALAAGPVVGGVLIALVGWRGIFFINLPIGLVGIVLTVRYAAETPQSRGRGLDIPGQLSAVVALAALAAATIEGGAAGWTDGWVLACFAISAVAGACFIGIEHRGRHPMLPLSLFRNPTFRATTLIGLLINVAFYGLLFVLSLLFQREQGFSALKAGLAFLPMTASIMVANLVAGRLTRRFGARAVILLGQGLMAVACLGLLWVTRGSAYRTIALQLLILGGGLGLIVPPMTSALLGSVDRSRSGIAAGTLFAMRQSGSVIGVALFGSLLAGGFIGGVHVALVISLAVLAIGGVAGLEIGSRSPSARTTSAVEGG